MEGRQTGQNGVKLAAFFVFLIFLAAVFFSFRAIMSIGSGLLFLLGLLYLWNNFSSLRNNKPVLIFLGGLVIFFIYQCISLIYTTDQAEGWRNCWTKSSLVATSMGVYGTLSFTRKRAGNIIFFFCILLAAALLYCLVNAINQYTRTGDTGSLFYFALLRSTGHHAIYFSVYVFSAIVFLSELAMAKRPLVSGLFHYSLLIFFIVSLFLLSSKLVLGCLILYGIYSLIRMLYSINARLAFVSVLTLLIAVILLLFVINNPVSRRFKEIIYSDLELVRAENNNPADYLNGLQFRLLQFKLVPSILNEQNAWIAGVSPGDAQHYLDKKYMLRNMYTGEPGRGDQGFLGYYVHNSFLEALLQGGVLGLLIILFIFSGLFAMAWQARKTGLVWIIGLVIAVAFTESVFESQHGIVLFCLLPLLVVLLQDHLKIKSNRERQVL